MPKHARSASLASVRSAHATSENRARTKFSNQPTVTYTKGWALREPSHVRRGSALFDVFEVAVDMFGEAARVAPVDRVVARPGPTAEARALVIREGLLDLGAAVHDERALRGDGLADRAPLQHQQLARVLAGFDFDFDVRAHDGGGVLGERAIVDFGCWSRRRSRACESLRDLRGLRQRPAGAGFELHAPDRDVGVGRAAQDLGGGGGGRLPASSPAIVVTSIAATLASSLKTWRGISRLPQHREVRFGELVFARQIKPIWKSSTGLGAFWSSRGNISE